MVTMRVTRGVALNDWDRASLSSSAGHSDSAPYRQLPSSIASAPVTTAHTRFPAISNRPASSLDTVTTHSAAAANNGPRRATIIRSRVDDSDDESIHPVKVRAPAGAKSLFTRVDTAASQRAADREMLEVVQQVRAREQSKSRASHAAPQADSEWSRLTAEERRIEREAEQTLQREKEKERKLRTKTELHATIRQHRTSTPATSGPKESIQAMPAKPSRLHSIDTITATTISASTGTNIPSINYDYYPTTVHALLSTTFSLPLSRLFKHYRGLAPVAAKSMSFNDSKLMSCSDWMMMAKELDIVPVLLNKLTAQRIFYVSANAQTKHTHTSTITITDTDQSLNGLGFGRFLKSMWSVACTIRLTDSLIASGSDSENEVRTLWIFLHYVRHHCLPDIIGPTVKLNWPDLSYRQALDTAQIISDASDIDSRKARIVKQNVPSMLARVNTGATVTEQAMPQSPPPHSQSKQSRVPTLTNTIGSTAASRMPALVPVPVVGESKEYEPSAASAEELARKERKRLRLRAQVEQYRSEQAEKARVELEEQLRQQSEKEARETSRKELERQQRDEEKRRIAEFKARRHAEIEEAQRLEAERAENEERERKRQLEQYLRAKSERKRQQEEKQRERLLRFQESLSDFDGQAMAVPVPAEVSREEPKKRKQWRKEESKQTANDTANNTSAIASDNDTIACVRASVSEEERKESMPVPVLVQAAAPPVPKRPSVTVVRDDDDLLSQLSLDSRRPGTTAGAGHDDEEEF